MSDEDERRINEIMETAEELKVIGLFMLDQSRELRDYVRKQSPRPKVINDDDLLDDFLHKSGKVRVYDYGSISIEELTDVFNSTISPRKWTKKKMRIAMTALGFESVRVHTKRGVKGVSLLVQ